MTIQTILIAATVLGTLASIGGLAIALVQTIRLRDLRRRDGEDLWECVHTAHTIIGLLEESKLIKESSAIGRGYTAASRVHRGLLKILALRERKFTQVTIDRWKAAHRLTNGFQESEAQRFIDIHE